MSKNPNGHIIVYFTRCNYSSMLFNVSCWHYLLYKKSLRVLWLGRTITHECSSQLYSRRFQKNIESCLIAKLINHIITVPNIFYHDNIRHDASCHNHLGSDILRRVEMITWETLTSCHVKITWKITTSRWEILDESANFFKVGGATTATRRDAACIGTPRCDFGALPSRRDASIVSVASQRLGGMQVPRQADLC